MDDLQLCVLKRGHGQKCRRTQHNSVGWTVCSVISLILTPQTSTPPTLRVTPILHLSAPEAVLLI